MKPLSKKTPILKNRSDLGKLMMLVGVLTMFPIVVLPFYHEEWPHIFAFLIPGFSSILLGLLACIFIKNKQPSGNYRADTKRGSLTVLFAWAYGFLLGATPFLFLGEYTFAESLFESASGWTTTGFTVMDVETLPQIFLFHRSFMQFCGGLGFILMMVMIMENKHSVSLFTQEGHGDQLRPSVIKTARTIFILYAGIFAAGVIGLVICGMPFFDSVIHCMSALSTGGFSNRAASYAFYDSVSMEIVTSIVMLLGMTNFAVLLLLARRKFRQAARVSEVKFTGVVLAVVIPVVALILCLGLSLPFGEGLRQSFFNTISVISTTGFATVDFATFPAAAMGIMILIMFIGGAAGSTAGGIKLGRAYLLFRGAGISVSKRLSAENRIDARYYYRPNGRAQIDNALLRDTYAYAFMYVLIFIITSLLLCWTANASLDAAMFDAASLSATVGVSVGVFVQGANTGTLIVGVFGMLIARLEIHIVLTGIISLFMIKGRKTR